MPLKPLPLAKARLRPQIGQAATSLALAMGQDVVSAALASAAVARTVVITRDATVAHAARELGAAVFTETPRAGLNAALLAAAADARTRYRVAQFILQPADCPCLLPADLDLVSETCRTLDRPFFVADSNGLGTTTLALPAAELFPPRYGAHSRTAHLSAGAVEADGPAWVRLRRDVDTLADLHEAVALGVGRHTRRWLTQRSNTV